MSEKPEHQPDTVADMYARIRALHEALPPLPAEIKLTREQLAQIPKADPAEPLLGGTIGAFTGVPVRIVESYWESTPGEKHLAELREAISIEMAGRDLMTYLFDRYGPYRPPGGIGWPDPRFNR